LARAKEEVAELQKELASYERDKISLRVSVGAQLCIYMEYIMVILIIIERQGQAEGSGCRAEELALGARSTGATICTSAAGI
jgi:hypothetical protein